MWTANHELTRWIDIILDIVIEQCQHLFATLSLHTWHKNVEYVSLNRCQHSFIVIIEWVVLRRNNDGINALRDIIVAIFYSNLTLRVRTQISHLLTFLTDFSQRIHDKMSQVERHWHVVLRLIGSITKHHALVTCTLFFFLITVNATVDIVALLMNGGQDTTRITVKLIVRLGISYLVDGSAGNGLQVYICFRAYLTHDNHLTRCTKRLYSATSTLVVSQKLVEQRITDLIRHFIGMSFRNRFRCKQIRHNVISSYCLYIN